MTLLFLLCLCWLGCTWAADDACMNLRFNDTLGDSMVLQRAPASSAVYGGFHTTFLAADAERIFLTVTVREKSGATQSYTVSAQHRFSHSDASVDGGSVSHYTFKAMLRAAPAGGNYEITVRCFGTAPTLGRPSVLPGTSVAIDNVTFGDVWYCGGQSNMALPLHYTVMRNESMAAVDSGAYGNIRLYSKKTNMNLLQQWATSTEAQRDGTLKEFSSTCWYFAQSLTDKLVGTEEEGLPIGLVHTAFGGSTIEDWLNDDTRSLCSDACKQNKGGLFDEFVQPFLDMTIKGWIWYQGENNMAARTCAHGNYIRRSGYACFIVELVRSWRKLWSATPGTTDPLAPFGIVAIPESGTLGGTDIGTFRWAQTAGYGVLPNPAMPNTFLVQAYDQDDPYLSLEHWGACDNAKCRKLFREGTCGEVCDVRCAGFCLNISATPSFIGLFHPRTKHEIGSRLGRAAATSVYGSNDKPTTGPTLAGCALGPTGENTLTVIFNRTLMVNDVVSVQDYDKSRTGYSKMEVLVDPSQFCMHRIHGVCIDDGYGNRFDKRGPVNKGWVAVDIAKSGSETVVVDLTKSGGVAHAIRYVWHGTCCNDEPRPDDYTRDHCPLGSCPIVGGNSGLPANPFMAKIVDGRCRCIPPQECDATL